MFSSRMRNTVITTVSKLKLTYDDVAYLCKLTARQRLTYKGLHTNQRWSLLQTVVNNLVVVDVNIRC